MRFSASDSDVLHQILRWRRDVRHFHPDPIPPDVLARLKEAMDCAPSVGNARPWRVVQVESPALRDAVRAEFERCRARAGALYTGEQRHAYDQLKLAGLDRAPLQLAVFCHADPAAGHGLGRQTQPETLMQSTAMAIHTLWLAARVENIGLGMVSIVEPQTLERLFGVAPPWHFAAYLCLGYPETHDDRPLLDRTGWQANAATDWTVV
ncbi:5,6-dimethylbenzimidazole synthase [Roseospira marina]|uniref:5,6-dimethylbenzimidazole synthase n=1 Tax=Roseospira marina TaxID=140057 RepID=A0A5M6IA45_9PROT|nr:5,6-dimethylbenzimidazole synthase [Roseospira marina]KAA5605121.1 5,6-dimethylbenzimidazole synthase [Roseospira marina]MBB4314872.1 5,6-dimethylbenzimidazole synthase [Roseospira marina]MBB5087872.1 5,6-dimethylbenzimidazole synthase [Roseospira marina]